MKEVRERGGVALTGNPQSQLAARPDAPAITLYQENQSNSPETGSDGAESGRGEEAQETTR